MENNLTCKHCKEIKPTTSFNQHRKSGKFQSYCKPCALAYKRERYATSTETREKAKQAAKAYAAANSDRVGAYQAQYRDAHREELNQAEQLRRRLKAAEIKAKARIHNQLPTTRLRIKLRHQKRLLTDPEYAARMLQHHRKAALKHYRKHRISLLEEARKLYWADPEKAREKTRRSVAKWQKTHPETLAATQARRKALRRGAVAEGFDDVAHYAMLQWWQQGRCYHCDDLLSAVQRDHLVPVMHGGRHEVPNLALACLRCNCSKHAKLLWKEWIPPLTYKSTLLLLNVEGIVVSTFAASERGCLNPRQALPELRALHPDEPIFFDWEWRNRRSAVLNVLQAYRGLSPRLAARRTQVVEVDTDDARAFLDQYHLQGFGRGTAYTGLVHDNELVAVAAWLELNGAIELNRMAFKDRVVGGAGKLLATFRRELLPSGMPIISFADLRYGAGTVYKKLGFEDAGETAHPVYYYTGPGGLYHRRLFTRDNMKKRLVIFDDSATEVQNAHINGYYRVFGLKQKRFILK